MDADSSQDLINTLRREISHEIAGNKDVEQAIKKIRTATDDERELLSTSFPNKDAPKDIKPGTVGEFLFGCAVKPKDLSVACTPSCISGLKRPDTSYCDIQTYLLHDGKLTKPNLVGTSATSAYLFSDVETVPDNVYSSIQNDGITSLSIYINLRNTIDYKYLSEVEIKPLRKAQTSPVQSPSYKDKLPYTPRPPCPSCPSKDKHKGDDSNTWVWLIIFMLVVLFIIFLVFMFNRKK